ncbi:MAG: nucleotidyltransferase family protein [Clostridia bacterium]|nr:nucleotidyltransferase family protein [Clostridia bacterium]
MKTGEQINPSEQAVLRLLNAALHKDIETSVPDNIDWREVGAIGRKHAILPLVLQGAVIVRDTCPIPDETLQEWKRFAVTVVMHNERSMQAQENIVSMLKTAGIPSVVLKGASVAASYPNPELRILGDIDLLVSEERSAEALDLLVANGYNRHEFNHPFHIGLDKAGIYLELHYAVTQFPDSAIGQEVKLLLNNAVDRATTARIGRYSFPVLSEVDQALSLLLHMERHLVNIGIGLRQLCDWCVFIGSLRADALKERVLPAIAECRLMQFAKTLTNVCVRYLGLDEMEQQWCLDIEEETARDLMLDILASGNIVSGEVEHNTGSRIVSGEQDGKKVALGISVLRSLTVSAKQQFRICRAVPLVIPFFWLYLPVRYYVRMKKGIRPKQDVRKIAKHAMRRKNLYQKMRLFKV